MSGIFGVSLLSGKFDEGLTDKSLQKAVTTLAIASQTRGRDAVGLAMTSGVAIKVVKKNMVAGKYINTEEYKKFIKELNLSNVYSVIGHCRTMMKGTAENMNNNHPIVTNNVVGVHDGFIHNDNNLFDVYQRAFSRAGSVDSEIIFKLIDHWNSIVEESLSDSIKRVSEVLRGSAAYAFVSALSPSVVCLVRNTGCPLEVRLYEKTGMVMFASTDYALNEAEKEVNLPTGERIPFLTGKALLICAKKNEFAEVSLTT